MADVRYVRVVWRSPQALDQNGVGGSSLLDTHSEIFRNLEFSREPRTVFQCDDDDLGERTREWAGWDSEADLPEALKGFHDAWFKRTDHAAEFINGLRYLSPAFVEAIDAYSPVPDHSLAIADDSKGDDSGLTGFEHLEAWPRGVCAEDAWRTKGGKGAWGSEPKSRIHVAVIDSGANLQHTELRDRVTLLAKSCPVRHHGTATLGILAPAHGQGRLKGLIPEAKIALVPVGVTPGDVTAEDEALWCVGANCPPGSVVLIERVAQRFRDGRIVGPELPLEAFSSVRETIREVVNSRGVSVVECAGNSNSNIDGFLVGADCGAVLVGAADLSELKRVSTSNCGRRIHLHASGRHVMTSGGSERFKKCIPKGGGNCYGTFSGTSCAGAIVAGVVASATALLSAAGKKLTPTELRGKLIESGGHGSRDLKGAKIGVLPNLDKFIKENV